MSDRGVSFAGEGAEDVSNPSYSTQPPEPMGTGSEVKFVDNGGGDEVSRAYGTNSRMNLDPVAPSENGGPGVSFVDIEGGANG